MSDQIKIVTFNLRSVWKGDGINAFIHRAGLIYEKIQKEQPDIVAFQEVIEPHYDLLTKLMPEYTFLGQFRNADYRGEGVYIAIKNADWMTVFYDVFWISPTPHVPASRFEGQSHCPRICATAAVRHKKSGKILRVANIHLDHIGEAARVKGIRCVLDKLAEYEHDYPLPTLLMGDFNAEPNSETIAMTNEVLQDLTAEIPLTFHDYGREDHCKIDYIYATPTFVGAVRSIKIWDDVNEGIYLSDHYPICAEFSVEEI